MFSFSFSVLVSFANELGGLRGDKDCIPLCSAPRVFTSKQTKPLELWATQKVEKEWSAVMEGGGGRANYLLAEQQMSDTKYGESSKLHTLADDGHVLCQVRQALFHQVPVQLDVLLTPELHQHGQEVQQSVGQSQPCTRSWVSCFTARDNSVERSHTVQKVPYSNDPEAEAGETPVPSGSTHSLSREAEEGSGERRQNGQFSLVSDGK
ncbi:hypothetical protein EYF80_049644 [Liparis tanakae]|uniref:Uncharacterized protein n=1 Tax=Liparis tanakae TaxID=230148 RepID=A0A4Z2FHD2_9TELE|nr:hypothetical protein EYF80_049644 [Liparis tanakae]